MKALAIILSLFVFASYISKPVEDESGNPKGNKKNDWLRYDGVYFKTGMLRPGHDQAVNYTYLRFFENGMVYRVQTASKPDQVARWLTPSRMDGRGKYKVKGTALYFTTHTGGVEYSHEGYIFQDTLKLSTYTAQNENMFEETFYFVPLKFRK